MKKMRELFDFIETSTSWKVSGKELNIKLPLYIKSGYELWNSEIAGFGVLFLKIKDTSVDMRMHQNARKKIEESCACHVVLVFDRLDNKNINSLLQKHIPFIIQGKQIYLPFALVQIQTIQNKPELKKHYKLSTDADMVLVGYLDSKIHNGMIIRDIAEIINRELRATSKALENLQVLNYITIEKVGRSKRVLFIDKEDVYDKLKIAGTSPIQYTFFSNNDFNDNVVYSGYSALSKHTSLMDDSIKTIAINSKFLKSMEINNIECEKEEAIYKVEVWDRDPSIFSNRNSVNQLYILRLLKDIDDERTEYALEEIENSIQNNLRK